MKKIAFVQPIFAPDEMRFNRNMDSLYSMHDYVRDNPYNDIEFHFGGWAKNKYWPTINKVIEDLFGNKTFILKKFEKNYGKARVVNTLMKDINSEYILLADSDIKFLSDQKNLFVRLIECVENSTKIFNKPFGMVALEQLGQCCHLPEARKNTKKYTNSFGDEEVLNYPNVKGGIAGGCIFLTKNAWDTVGGYREMGIYCGDDAYLLVDMWDKKMSIQVIHTLGISHPHEHDPVYAKWKVKVCQRDSGRNRKILDSQIKEAEIFWDEHGKN